MSLNLKLQSSVQKNQARTIDLEVKSIEAKECKELLSIVQVRHFTLVHDRFYNHSLAILA
jgi:hypothetical protein